MVGRSTTQKHTDSLYLSRSDMHSEPEFWDHIIRSLPVCIELEKNYKQIRNEFVEYYDHHHPHPCNGENMMPSPNLKIEQEDGETEKYLYSGRWDVCFGGTEPLDDGMQWGNTELVKKFVKWKTKADLNWQLDYAKSHFKTFNSIVSELSDPGQCSGAMFSLVSPETVIIPHKGSDKIMRVHLCLVNDDKCILTVGSSSRKWEEGKVLAFKDGGTYEHSVIHKGTQNRINLIFDFELKYLRGKFPKQKYL